MPRPAIRIKGRVIAATAFVVLLAGCGAGATTDGGSNPVTAVTPPVAAAPPAPQTEKPQKPTPRLALRLAPALPATRLTFKPINQRLAGLDGAQVTGLLGRPGFKRRESPAEIWQYRGRTCVLDVFFGAQSGKLLVNYAEIRGLNVRAPSEAACLRELFATAAPSDKS